VKISYKGLVVLPWVRPEAKNNEIFRPGVDTWCTIETEMSSPVGDVLQHVHRQVSNARLFGARGKSA
jgi:hypothetical protein